jgi:hypothetical protein
MKACLHNFRLGNVASTSASCRRTLHSIAFALVLVALLFGSNPVIAQAAPMGAVSGTVTDGNGGVALSFLTPAFGQIIQTRVNQRIIQSALKINF